MESTADKIKKCKQLLDNGAIDKQEFETIRQELLDQRPTIPSNSKPNKAQATIVVLGIIAIAICAIRFGFMLVSSPAVRYTLSPLIILYIYPAVLATIWGIVCKAKPIIPAILSGLGGACAIYTVVQIVFIIPHMVNHFESFSAAPAVMAFNLLTILSSIINLIAMLLALNESFARTRKGK